MLSPAVVKRVLVFPRIGKGMLLFPERVISRRRQRMRFDVRKSLSMISRQMKRWKKRWKKC